MNAFRIQAFVIAAALAGLSGTASASMDLAKAKNCTACHAVDKKLIAPRLQGRRGPSTPATQDRGRQTVEESP